MGLSDLARMHVRSALVTAEWGNWVGRHLSQKGWRPADASRASGVSASIISRWLDGQMDPGVENLRKFAEAVDVPILEAFVAAGYLTAEEAGQPPAPAADPADLNTMDLLEEIRTRIASHLDALDPPPPRRNSQPPQHAQAVPDGFGLTGELDQTGEDNAPEQSSEHN